MYIWEIFKLSFKNTLKLINRVKIPIFASPIPSPPFKCGFIYPICRYKRNKIPLLSLLLSSKIPTFALLFSQKVTGQPVNDFLPYLFMHIKQNSQDWALGASLLQVLKCTNWLYRLVMGHKIAFPYVIILPKTELMRLVKKLQWLLLVC